MNCTITIVAYIVLLLCLLMIYSKELKRVYYLIWKGKNHTHFTLGQHLYLFTLCNVRVFLFSSFQFETETESTKLRRDVSSEGNVGSGGTPTAIISLLSGQEEMFAFRRAVSIFPFSLFITFKMRSSSLLSNKLFIAIT